MTPPGEADDGCACGTLRAGLGCPVHDEDGEDSRLGSHRAAAVAALEWHPAERSRQPSPEQIAVAQVHALLYMGDALHRCADAFDYVGD